MADNNFIGGSYLLKRRKADIQRSINLMPTPIESGSGKSNIYLAPTPGLRVFDATVPVVVSPPNPLGLLWLGEYGRNIRPGSGRSGGGGIGGGGPGPAGDGGTPPDLTHKCRAGPTVFSSFEAGATLTGFDISGATTYTRPSNGPADTFINNMPSPSHALIQLSGSAGPLFTGRRSIKTVSMWSWRSSGQVALVPNTGTLAGQVFQYQGALGDWRFSTREYPCSAKMTSFFLAYGYFVAAVDSITITTWT